MTKKPDQDIDWVDVRVEELAEEIQRRFEQKGEKVTFGFATAIASYAFIQMAYSIADQKRRLGGIQAIAFGQPAQDTALIRKSASYAFKWLISDYMALTVADLIALDGRTEEFDDLYRQTLCGTPENVQKAQQRLDKAVAPYARKASEIMKSDIDHYNPFRPGSLTNKSSR